MGIRPAYACVHVASFNQYVPDFVSSRISLWCAPGVELGCVSGWVYASACVSIFLLTQCFNTGMKMYVVLKQKVQRHRQGPHRLIRYRCPRTSSGLEASFLHYRASMHPGGKALSLESLHVRHNLWEWGWNTDALQQSGEIPEVGHSWLWLVDLLADVCSTSKMFPNSQDLPKEVRHWTRTKTGCQPCTIRGVDWECVKARNACKAAGTDISPLTSEDTVKRAWNIQN